MSRILVVEDDEVLRNELIELLRNEGYEAEYISTFSDTAGQIIKSKPDLVLLDIKQINEQEHVKLTGQTNANILAMARELSDMGKPVWIRHVLVTGGSDKDEYLHQLADFIHTLKNVERVEVLPYHTLGIFKWEKLGIPYPLEGVKPPTQERIDNARRILGAI